MTEEKPAQEESTRTASAAAIVTAFDLISKSHNMPLRTILSAARRKSTIGAVAFAALTAWSVYKAADNATSEPPAYAPATAFVLLAAGAALGTSKSTRRLLMINHYLKMEEKQGQHATLKSMREFAAPSLKFFENT